ncbi:Retrotransposon-derived protein PEG10 [Anabarilius grahami]|uniref:Retrotransposon-derived protein PEG10 n=1 Tax=Anabarilius grahami TaxID=495550 RepID=A0A3N0XY80_ANAGA|nr:Retrotransposon-derived protein PEG10 [Anabarilius grahami]
MLHRSCVSPDPLCLQHLPALLCLLIPDSIPLHYTHRKDQTKLPFEYECTGIHSRRSWTLSSEHSRATPVTSPAPYYGSAEDRNGFLLQCSLALDMRSQRFPTKRAKIAYIITLLRRRALHWAQTTWNQGLNPRLRLHLAAYEDAIGLERFIHLSILTDCRMQPCLEDLQGQPSPPHLRQPESASSPEPEAMQLDSTRLTVSERQRTLTQGLLHALLDSGSAGNFISESLCRQLNLKKRPIKTYYQFQSIIGKPLNKRNVPHAVGPIQLQVGLLHSESIVFLVLENSTAGIILGHPWLVQHDPILSWNTGEVLNLENHPTSGTSGTLHTTTCNGQCTAMDPG